uniref:Uncharacterized protein n=2 Tax=Lygus hesperus TaxID=30085 RepID=A0A0A9VX38_LYGHE
MASSVDPLVEFGELCRLCGAKTSVLMGLHIFEREGSLREIFKKIKACLPIQVTNDDKLPKMVCEECVYKLDALYEFREKSVKTEYLLNSMMKGLYASTPSNQHYTPPPSLPIETPMCTPTMAGSIQLGTQVEVHIAENADQLDSIIITGMPMTESEQIKHEPGVKRNSKSIIEVVRNIEGNTSDSLVSVTDADHSADNNCTITEHIVNNIQVADMRSLQAISSSNQEITSLKTTTDEQGNRHFIMATHSEQPWFFCDICGKPFGDSNEFQAHCEIHWKKCQLCGVTCANEEALMLHLRESHNTSLQQLESVEPKMPEQPMSSQPDSASGQQQASAGIMSDSEELHTTEVVDEKPTKKEGGKDGSKSCAECGKEYKTNYKLAEHMRKHTGEKPFKCSMCDKTFRSKIGLAQHEARHTGHYDYTCSTCGKGFQCKSYLIVHQRVHSDLKPYPCDTCGRHFKTKQSLLDHQNRHLGVKPYLCETCGRGFITKGLCKSHQKVHSGTDNRQYPCSVCSKLFVSKSYLATHMRIHTGEKPFMCEVCGKGFLTRVDLKIHSTMHTGEKSFVCEVCGKAFARRDALRCHKRSHTGERPYKCDVCGQGFTQFSPMAIHKRLHTGERPYACDICSKTFVSRSTMMCHRKKHAVS